MMDLSQLADVPRLKGHQSSTAIPIPQERIQASSLIGAENSLMTTPTHGYFLQGQIVTKDNQNICDEGPRPHIGDAGPDTVSTSPSRAKE